jgi:hypothetical protein
MKIKEHVKRKWEIRKKIAKFQEITIELKLIQMHHHKLQIN